VENVAKKILTSVKAMVPGRFTVEPATPDTHPHVKWGAYHRVREAALALGLRHLDDVDVTSIHHDPAMMKRAVLAIFVNDEGTEVVGYYRMALRYTLMGVLARLFANPGDVFDVSTNFDGGEGVTLQTTNARNIAVWDTPSFIQRETLNKGASLSAVLERHRARVREYRLQHPEARPTVVRALGDFLGVINRFEQRSLAWRRERGWATRDEIQRVSKLSGRRLDAFYEAFRKEADQPDIAPASGVS
jgi:hypothetical protein